MTEPIEPTELTLAPAPYVTPAPAKRPRRLAAGVAVLAMGAGAFGVLALSAGDGAESPEEAVEAMFDAIDNEDVIGVLEALDPAERQILRPAIEETGEQAKRVELASEDLDLRKVRGIEVNVEGLTFTTEALGDGMTAVDLTGGTVSSATDLDRMPFGATIRDILDEDVRDTGSREDRKSSDDIELAGVRLVATESGAGWHVSALYSIAEQIRLEADPPRPVPDFGNGIAAEGAASPEAAVREAIDAAVKLDVRRLIELTPPGEAAVLHDYGPMLVDDAEADGPVDGADIEVTGLELETADGSDGTKVVSAASFDVKFTDDYSTTTWAYDGTCTTTTYDYEGDPSGDEGGTYEGGGILTAPSDPETIKVCDGEQGALAAYSPLSLLTFSAPGSWLHVVTEAHDGQWFVSPTRSILETTVGGLRSLSTEDVRQMARYWSGDYWVAEPDSFWEACGVDAPPADASSADGEAIWEDCIDNLPDDYVGSSMRSSMGSSMRSSMGSSMGSSTTATSAPAGS